MAKRTKTASTCGVRRPERQYYRIWRIALTLWPIYPRMVILTMPKNRLSSVTKIPTKTVCRRMARSSPTMTPSLSHGTATMIPKTRGIGRNSKSVCRRFLSLRIRLSRQCHQRCPLPPFTALPHTWGWTQTFSNRFLFRSWCLRGRWAHC